MEEFKNAKWEILYEDLQCLAKEELIQTVIDKQYEIDLLKYEVTTELLIIVDIC